MLKILNVMEEGRFAGPHKRVFELTCSLRDNHQIKTVVVFPSQQSEYFQQLLKEKQIPFYAIRIFRLTKDLKHLLGYFLNFFPEVLRMRAIIKQEKPDLVNCTGSYQLKGIIASWLAGVPNVWHMEDTYIPKYVRFVFKMVYKLFSSRQFIFVSERTRQFYFPGDKVEELKDYALIPAPIDTSSFTPNIAHTEPYSDQFDGVRIITVGHINANKNHELFIRIAHAFQQQYPDIKIRFYIAGAIFDSQKALYRSLCKLIEKLKVNNVEFLGERRDIKELLKFSDIYFCSSAYEASPIAVWEALAMAKPVISTDVGDIAKFFDKYHCGLVGNKNSPKEWAMLLGELVMDEAKRSEMAKNARRAAIEELELSICAEKHAHYYKKVTN